MCDTIRRDVLADETIRSTAFELDDEVQSVDEEEFETDEEEYDGVSSDDGEEKENNHAAVPALARTDGANDVVSGAPGVGKNENDAYQ